MTDIDDLMASTMAQASAIDAIDGVRAWSGDAVAASGANAVLAFGATTYDTAGIWTAPTTFLFPPGYWLINVTMKCTVVGNTNVAGMWITYNGRFYQSQVANILQSVTQMENTFMIRAVPGGGNLTVTGTASGTGGGNFSMSDGVLAAHRLRVG